MLYASYHQCNRRIRERDILGHPWGCCLFITCPPHLILLCRDHVCQKTPSILAKSLNLNFSKITVSPEAPELFLQSYPFWWTASCSQQKGQTDQNVHILPRCKSVLLLNDCTQIHWWTWSHRLWIFLLWKHKCWYNSP